MGCITETFIFSEYTITCDVCGVKVILDTREHPRVYNRRSAVRSIGWSIGRNEFIKCDKCRSKFNSLNLF